MNKKKIESYYIIKVGKVYMTNKTVVTGNLALSDYIGNASRWNLRIDVRSDRDIDFNREVESDVINALRSIQELGVSDVRVVYREEYSEEYEEECKIYVNNAGKVVLNRV